MDLKQAVKEFFRAEQALSDHIRACDTSTCLQREALHTAYSDAQDELKAILEATPDALVNAEQNYKILLENTDSEIAENNAGFDAGEKGLDRDLARVAYLDGKPDYDVFDTGYVMGVLKGDAGNLDKLLAKLERYKAALNLIAHATFATYDGALVDIETIVDLINIAKDALQQPRKFDQAIEKAIQDGDTFSLGVAFGEALEGDG